MNECNHFNSKIEGHEPVGTVTCQDCGEELGMFQVWNAIIEAQNQLFKDISKAIKEEPS